MISHAILSYVFQNTIFNIAFYSGVWIHYCVFNQSPNVAYLGC